MRASTAGLLDDPLKRALHVYASFYGRALEVSAERALEMYLLDLQVES